tara:strand:- start:83 stop:499 length:417 start_codon:yes stop_codon:yes gene_type:complete
MVISYSTSGSNINKNTLSKEDPSQSRMSYIEIEAAIKLGFYRARNNDWQTSRSKISIYCHFLKPNNKDFGFLKNIYKYKVIKDPIKCSQDLEQIKKQHSSLSKHLRGEGCNVFLFQSCQQIAIGTSGADLVQSCFCSL